MNRLFVCLAAILAAGEVGAQLATGRGPTVPTVPPADVIGMPPPQKQKLFGWAGPAAAAEARAKLGDRMPAELSPVLSADEYRGRRIGLWDFTQDRRGGKHWPTIKQEIGDCVSHGWAHAILMTLAVTQSLQGADPPLVKPFPPYIYGASRVLVGNGRISGDGSVGAWAAAAVKEHGVLPESAAGCPKYSGELARQWGRSGPPKEFVEVARKSLADVRLVATWDECISAIATGHAVSVCSDAGFEKIVEKNGRIEGVRQGNWPHCMCFVGFDCREGLEAVYCWNSWGDDAHAPAESYARLDGAPPGGFWILRRDAERMLAQKDSFAVSFTSFKALPLWGRGPKEEEIDAPLEIVRSPDRTPGRARDRRRPFVPGLHVGL